MVERDELHLQDSLSRLREIVEQKHRVKKVQLRMEDEQQRINPRRLAAVKVGCVVFA